MGLQWDRKGLRGVPAARNEVVAEVSRAIFAHCERPSWGSLSDPTLRQNRAKAWGHPGRPEMNLMHLLTRALVSIAN